MRNALWLVGCLAPFAMANSAEEKNTTAWAPLLDEYLDTIERLVWPDLIILGGGISKKPEKFVPYLTTRAPIVTATLQNEAGIVGAGVRARELTTPARPPRPRATAATTSPARSRSRAGSAR